MRDFNIGDRVTLFDRAYLVRGFSPMSVTPPCIHLEDAETGELVEIALEQLAMKAPPGGIVSKQGSSGCPPSE